MASFQSLGTADGKRLASLYFKKSAGVFLYIRDTHAARLQLGLERTSDLTSEFLTAAAQIMLAQAMECYYEKANEDKVKSESMSLLAAHTADYFDLALRCSKESLSIVSKQRFPRTWLQQLTAKACMYAALAHFHAPLQLAPDQAVAERVSRLTLAKRLASRALCNTNGGSSLFLDSIKKCFEMIDCSYNLANAANVDSYHQPNVDESLICTLRRPKTPFAEPISFQDAINSLTRFDDMFSAYQSSDRENDAKSFISYGMRVVGFLSKELETMKKETSEKISGNSGIKYENLKNIIQENKARGLAIIRHMQAIHGHEKKEPLKEMMKKIDLMHIIVNEQHFECTNMLDSISKSNSSSSDFHGALCKALHQSTMLLAPCKENHQKLHSMLSSKEIVDFNPLAWSTENMVAVMPTAVGDDILPIAELVNEKLRETAVSKVIEGVSMLKKLVTSIDERKNEIRNFVENIDFDNLKEKNTITLQKHRLRLLEEAIARIREEKEAAFKKVSISTVAEISEKRKAAEQERSTIESFERSIEMYENFRSMANLEIFNIALILKEMDLIRRKCTELYGRKSCTEIDGEDSIQSLLVSQSERLKSHPVDAKQDKTNSDKIPASDTLKHAVIPTAGNEADPVTFLENHDNDPTSILHQQLELNHQSDRLLTDSGKAHQSVLDFLKSLLPPNSNVLTQLKEEEECPDVLITKEVQKFENLLLSIGATTQQKIMELNAIHAKKEKAAKDAAEAELMSRKAVERLSGKAWSVLQESCMVGLNIQASSDSTHRKGHHHVGENLKYENLAGEASANAVNHPGTGDGKTFLLHRHPSKYFHERINQRNISADASIASESVCQSRQQRKPTRRFTTSEEKYNIFYDADLYESPESTSTTGDERENIGRDAIKIAQQAQKTYHKFDEAAKKCSQKAQEYHLRAEEAKIVEESIRKAIESASVVTEKPRPGHKAGIVDFIREEAAHLGHVVWDTVVASHPTELDPPPADNTNLAAFLRLKGKGEKKKEQESKAMDRSRAGRFFASDPLNSLNVALEGLISIDFISYPNWSDATPITPPVRKPVDLTKPGMANKSEQMDGTNVTEPIRKMATPKKVKKYDSGIGGLGSAGSERLGSKDRKGRTGVSRNYYRPLTIATGEFQTKMRAENAKMLAHFMSELDDGDADVTM
ncbi:Rhophilin, Rho GTPase binding protein [Entophlyctis luteolus]|nr:Rhophilin, Rho GTPase binding protein [Entophlyctis luteolus]